MTPPVKSLRAIVSGRVQGVWFRGWTEREAKKRGLDGWVRNLPDGTVEALFSGPADAVEAMVDACWQGPPAARVASVEVSPADPPAGPGFAHLRR